MKRLVINLARSPERWRFMAAQSDRHGLGLTRLEAVDGTAIAETEVRRLCAPDAFGRRLTRFELACYFSHMAAWRAVADSAAAFGAVFEDDVFLAEDIAMFLGSPDWVPADADVVKLTANDVKVHLSARARPTLSGRVLHHLRSRTVDAGGYVVSARYARRLLAAGGHFAEPVDRVLLDPSRGATLYQLVPGVCVQGKWADFDFLPHAERGSLVQLDKPRKTRTLATAIGPRKIRSEARNLWRKTLFPALLPVLQTFTPEAERIVVAAVAFRKEAAAHG